MERPFNPKVVTQASWTREKPKPKPNGPLLYVDRSYLSDSKSKWTPMSPRTKGRVKYARLTQLIFRVLALLGALGSLFCGIVIKNASTVVIWIMRIVPAVAILHTIYGVYHLSRSPVTRPAASQASYMLFASALDAAFTPFYAFIAFVGYQQYTQNLYHWDSFFANAETTHQVAQVAFICSVVNAGLHGLSLILAIFLAVIFRQISRLPPDMNPLEDNLTARPHKRTKSEIAEKHTSQSSMDSTDPLIGPPRTIPFMHTRTNSSGTEPRKSEETRKSRVTVASNHLSHAVNSSLEMPAEEQPNESCSHVPQISADSNYVPARPLEAMFPNSLEHETRPDIPDRDACLSPDSENWVIYPSRSPSPVNVVTSENVARRDPSSTYSRSNTTASTASSMRDWLTSAQRYGNTSTRGGYTSLTTTHEDYGNDEIDDISRQTTLYDDIEQDLGERHFGAFPDDSQHEDRSTLSFNPLAMNPPTPQPPTLQLPTDEASYHDTPSRRRIALSDIPNVPNNQPLSIPPLNSIEKKARFYGQPQENIMGQAANIEDEPRALEVGKRRNRLAKRASGKPSTYNALSQDDDENTENMPVNPSTIEGDRKGRVVSNSGADIGSSSTPYGSYISGLGVGRRRDVSGKIAEEGRSGSKLAFNNSNGQPASIRAAGWARFAGL